MLRKTLAVAAATGFVFGGAAIAGAVTASDDPPVDQSTPGEEIEADQPGTTAGLDEADVEDVDDGDVNDIDDGDVNDIDDGDVNDIDDGDVDNLDVDTEDDVDDGRVDDVEDGQTGEFDGEHQDVTP